MTVAELVAKLRDLPQELPVYLLDDAGWPVYRVTAVTAERPGSWTSGSHDSDWVLLRGEQS